MEVYYQDTKKILVSILNKGRTKDCEEIMKWISLTGKIPLFFQRQDDENICFECSEIFTAKIKFIIERGEAVGKDGKIYTFTNKNKFPDNLTPICGNICIFASVKESMSNGEWYPINFFV